ncbi:MAG: FAD-binding oxidoreductase [Devosia sp.]
MAHAAQPSPEDETPIAAFRKGVVTALGPDCVLDDPDRMVPYLREWRDLYEGITPFVLRPKDTEAVAQIVRLAGEYGVALVPQAGNTGLCGAQIPDETGREVVVSLERLDDIAPPDTDGDTITVGAGAILADVQAAADGAGRLFPLSLGSEGSARIGGLIGTNAGGTGVLAYGNMRSLVLGLEVVLPDGTVWNGLRSLRKDNTGYDLKHLFIGSEGTLGIITRAVLALVSKPSAVDVAMVGVASPSAALTLLAKTRAALGNALTAFELMPRFGLEIVLEHGSNVRSPFQTAPAPWLVLIEASSRNEPLREVLESVLMAAYEDGTVSDAVVSQSLTEAQDFWRIREQLSEMQNHEGGSIKHDVSVPVAAVPAFIEEASAAAEALVPGCRMVPFGHLGDGNIHFNVSQPLGADKAQYLSRWNEMNEAVHAVVRRHKGSIAAEHGIGRLKRDLVKTVRSPVEVALMRTVKQAIDPQGLMNPGRILPPE